MNTKLKMYQKLGCRLIYEGVKMSRTAYKDIERHQHSRSEIKEFLQGIGITGVSLYDQQYYTCSWSVWQSFIKNTFIQQTKYESDTTDCDKYARFFSALSSWTLKCNTGGFATGPIYFKASGNQVNRHCFNLILTEDFGEIKPILFEPMYDTSNPWNGNKTALGDYLYAIDWYSL